VMYQKSRADYLPMPGTTHGSAPEVPLVSNSRVVLDRYRCHSLGPVIVNIPPKMLSDPGTRDIWGSVTRKPTALVHGQSRFVPPMLNLIVEQPRRDKAAAGEESPFLHGLPPFPSA